MRSRPTILFPWCKAYINSVNCFDTQTILSLPVTLFFLSNWLQENKKLIVEQNILLEKNVEERTLELKKTNEHLVKVIKDLKDTQAQLIQKEKKSFETLPFASKWFKRIIGKGWDISNYLVRV